MSRPGGSRVGTRSGRGGAGQSSDAVLAGRPDRRRPGHASARRAAQCLAGAGAHRRGRLAAAQYAGTRDPGPVGIHLAAVAGVRRRENHDGKPQFRPRQERAPRPAGSFGLGARHWRCAGAGRRSKRGRRFGSRRRSRAGLQWFRTGGHRFGRAGARVAFFAAQQQQAPLGASPHSAAPRRQ